MASLDSLPADQRAVLQLVLQRDRTYDDIAAMLSIDRTAVRQRALAALDALGPHTGVPAERRALLTDYLLGQLPARVSASTRERLAESASERAWARVVASELSSISTKELPEIPVESTRREREPEEHSAEPSLTKRAERRGEPAAVAAAKAAAVAAAEPAASSDAQSSESRRRGPQRSGDQRSSRAGGAVLLGVAFVAIIVAIVLITSGGSSKHPTSTVASTPTGTPASSTAVTTTSTAVTTTPQVVRQINLTSPSAPTSKTTGLADVLKQGATNGIAIVAQNVTPNTKRDAYAVWLYNSPSDSHILGYVNPGVGTNGRLSTAGALPTNASHYKQLIVTLETQSNPRVPGKIILQGQLS